MALIANVNRNPKKQKQPFEPKDFNPMIDKREERKANWSELKRMMTNGQ